MPIPFFSNLSQVHAYLLQQPQWLGGVELVGDRDGVNTVFTCRQRLWTDIYGNPCGILLHRSGPMLYSPIFPPAPRWWTLRQHPQVIHVGRAPEADEDIQFACVAVVM